MQKYTHAVSPFFFLLSFYYERNVEIIKLEQHKRANIKHYLIFITTKEKQK